LIDISCF